MESGGAKKFLYSETEKEGNECCWNHAPNVVNAESNTSTALDFKDVWSIKKNVNIGSQSDNPFVRKAGKEFYSRYGGLKDVKDTSDTNSSDRNPDGMSQWTGTCGSRLSYSQTGNQSKMNFGATYNQAASHVGEGYHSYPTPLRSDSSDQFGDENDF